MKLNKKFESVLFFADTHIPYHHRDYLEFLKLVKETYKPDLVIHGGDEVDNHAISFHDKDPNLQSPKDELVSSIKCLKKLYKVFPKLHLLRSNHGSLAERKLKFFGLPALYLRELGDVYGVPDWKWHNELIIKLSDNTSMLLRHDLSRKTSLMVAYRNSCNVMGAHYHTKFSIEYAANHEKLYWAVSAPCLLDEKSLAMAYAKTNSGTAGLDKCLLGCVMVISGHPILIPMILNKRGRWIGILR